MAYHWYQLTIIGFLVNPNSIDNEPWLTKDPPWLTRIFMHFFMDPPRFTRGTQLMRGSACVSCGKETLELSAVLHQCLWHKNGSASMTALSGSIMDSHILVNGG